MFTSVTQVDNLAGMTGQANKQLTDKMKKLESENKALKKGKCPYSPLYII